MAKIFKINYEPNIIKVFEILLSNKEKLGKNRAKINRYSKSIAFIFINLFLKDYVTFLHCVFCVTILKKNRLKALALILDKNYLKKSN
ncbi:hypothetical protein BpHYR1_033416 [Brachionus plicatilis]|uniref:Uncharacterized protein n=1 Tax=Brachionus plicatilis TaxID=10195 RepID=A0A3M7R873_BRAPC|nr:hypothetical protein BpHYR1_033416 [Brachionus plicatilis]